MSGYVKLYRKFMRHEYWTEPRVFSKAEAFLYLFVKARYEPWTDADGFAVGRGEVVTTLRKLAHDWQWSVNRVRRFLDTAERGSQVDTKTEHGRTHIRITNYEKYQGLNEEGGTETDHKRIQKRNTDGHVYKKNKETKKEEVPSLTLPAEIDTFEVRSALQRWLSHKAEKRQSYKTTGLNALVTKLAKLSPERIVSAIDHSISQNYSGIYEPSTNGNGAARPRTTFEKSSAAIADAIDAATRKEFDATKEALGFLAPLFIEAPKVKS